MSELQQFEQFKWDSRNEELLKKYWAEGKTCSQIAALIPGSSRNSVIGKVHRLGLARRNLSPSGKSSRPKQGAPMKKVPSIAAPKVAALAPLPKPIPVLLPDVEDGRITILHLSSETCKWPIGDPQHKDFQFCGHPPSEGKIYCEYHCREAYVGKVSSAVRKSIHIAMSPSGLRR